MASSAPAAINLAQSARIAAIANRAAGLHIKPEKTEFFEHRLRKRIQALGLNGFGAYVAHLESRDGADELRPMVEALTTHTTSFFRENHHFDFLMKTGFDALVANGAGRQRPLSFWSAACSTGAELYSALMTFTEYREARGEALRTGALGTDISRRILTQASRATFGANEITGVSEARRRRFLLRHRAKTDRFRIEAPLRSLASWQHLNLTEPDRALPRDVDVIFLRNVLIYFEPETQNAVIGRLCAALAPGGYLLTGHSESISTPPPGITVVGPSIYRREEG